MTQKSPNESAEILRPTMPTGQEAFDSIMEKIEPDLTTKNVKKLAEKYGDETPEQMRERSRRYESAYAKAQGEMKVLQTKKNTEMNTYARTRLATTEANDRNRDERTKMNSLEAQFNSNAI